MNAAKVNAVLAAMFSKPSPVPEPEHRMPWPRRRKQQEVLSEYHRVGSQWLYLEDQLQRWYGAPMYVYEAGVLVRSPKAKHSVFYRATVPRMPLAEWKKIVKRENSAGVPAHLREPDFPE